MATLGLKSIIDELTQAEKYIEQNQKFHGQFP